MKQGQLIATKLKRRKLYRQFKKDARRSVIDYVKEMYPRTWFFHLLLSFAWLDGAWIDYFKYTEIWCDDDHWFFKKWDIDRTYWHSDYKGWLKQDPDIKFNFSAWLCFRRGF